MLCNTSAGIIEKGGTMKIEAQKIIDAIKKVIIDPDVQPGYPDANGRTNTTWCNRGAHRIAVMCGGDMTAFLDPRGINWTTANMMYQNTVKNAVEIYGAAAHNRALEGELILAACYNPSGPGHVAIVCPSEEEYNDTLGPLVGETGAKCRIAHSKMVFEKYGYTARFFIIPHKV
jgi:hypothetical protein